MEIPSSEKLLTVLLSSWGALLSTFLAGIKLAEFLQGQTRIHVSLKRDMKVYPVTAEYGEKTYIIVTAANRGQRPVLLGNAGLVYRKTWRQRHGGCIATNSLRQPQPIKLEEGMTYDFTIDQESAEKNGIGPRGYIGFVCDRTGRTSYSHGWLGRLIRIWRFK